jgi:hypothetical protein
MDRLVDFMLAIPVCLSLVDQLITRGVVSVQVEDVKQKVAQIDQQLDRWWTDYQGRFTVNGQTELYRDIEDDWVDSSGIYHPLEREFQYDDLSECMIHYGLCRLLVALMKYTFEEPLSPLARTTRTQALFYSAFLLSVSAFTERRTTIGRTQEYYYTVIPILMAIFIAPSKAHRAYAKSKIDRWAIPHGYKGPAVSDVMLMHRWENLSAVWGDLV